MIGSSLLGEGKSWLWIAFVSPNFGNGCLFIINLTRWFAVVVVMTSVATTFGTRIFNWLAIIIKSWCIYHLNPVHLHANQHNANTNQYDSQTHPHSCYKLNNIPSSFDCYRRRYSMLTICVHLYSTLTVFLLNMVRICRVNVHLPTP